jgi:Branched-chain amino acid transport protein (AzlD)
VRDDVWLVIAGMAVATYLTRAPLLLALARRPLPPRLTLWLRLIPLAVLPALAVPMVLVARIRRCGAPSSCSRSPPGASTCSSPSASGWRWWRSSGRWANMHDA